MARPTVLPVEEKVRVVLAVLAGEMTTAALRDRRRSRSSRSGTGSGSSSRPAAPGSLRAWGKLSTREQQFEAEVADLTTALGKAAVELWVWKKSAEGRLGPSRTSR